MKNSTRRIIETFPKFAGKLKAYENNLLVEEAMKGLNEVEATFLKLAWYFEEPEHGNFTISLLYHHLDDSWLEFALELITQFFREDTYLIKKPTFYMIREEDDHYFNQKMFAEFLKENGLNYSRSKLNVYYDRGKIPKADIELAGKPYWCRSTVEDFCEQEKNRLKMD
jgi:hypothetical protein